MPKASTPTARRHTLAAAVSVAALSAIPLAVATTASAAPLSSSAQTQTQDRASTTDSSAATPPQHSAMVTRHLLVHAAADSFVAYRHPGRTVGSAGRLVASGMRHDRKVTYLKFQVQGLPAGADVRSATVRLTRDLHHLPTTRLNLHDVRSTWTQRFLTARHAPHGTGRVDRRWVNRSMSVVRLSVRKAVHHNGTYAFALTSSSRRDVARFQSRETAHGPVLMLTYRVATLLEGHPTPVPAPTTPASPSPGTGHCDLSAKLVPSCGILFGGALDSFGGNDLYTQYTNFNAGTGEHMTIQHDYRRPGQTLSPYDIKVADAPDALLQLNWKPSYTWSQAAGGDATVNSQIDAMAQSIKSLGSNKIFLTLFHEPENDVSGGATGCSSSIYKGNAGTPADYRAMWANVEARFTALGVTNVVWDMNYMNYSVWDCMVDDLWPGNSLVDWVFFESYSSNGYGWNAATSHMYDLLSSTSDAQHDYLSKPWGIGEFGTDATSDADQVQYYRDMKTSLDDNTYPHLKLISAYDSPVNGIDYRVAYDDQGHSDPAELASFERVAADPLVRSGVTSVAGG
jgi:hypothetical protein